MTEQVQLTPDNLTISDIRKWDANTMKEYMQTPLRDRIFELIREAQVVAEDRKPQDQLTYREAASRSSREAEKATEAEVARQAAAAQQATADVEAARVAAAAEVVKPKKIVVEYQVRDEDGNPIGRPTHLEATSEEEIRNKVIEAHVQATRAFHRLKKQKLSFKEQQQQPAQTQQPGLSDAELLQAIKDTKSDDLTKALEAQKKIAKSEFERNLDPLRQENEKLKTQLRVQEVSRQFLVRHKDDFNNCEANVKLIGEYIRENDLDWTLDNLEIAFVARESELAPVDRVPVPSAVSANPTTTITAAADISKVSLAPSTAAANPGSATPGQTAPAQTVQPANQQAQPRPGVNGGIEPGSTSAVRQAQEAPTRRFTIAEIQKWDSETMKKHMRIPADRAEVLAVIEERNAKIAALKASQQR